MDDLLRDLKAIKLPRGRRISQSKLLNSIGLERQGLDCWVASINVCYKTATIKINANPTPAEARWLTAAMYVACKHVEG